MKNQIMYLILLMMSATMIVKAVVDSENLFKFNNVDEDVRRYIYVCKC